MKIRLNTHDSSRLQVLMCVLFKHKHITLIKRRKKKKLFAHINTSVRICMQECKRVLCTKQTGKVMCVCTLYMLTSRIFRKLSVVVCIVGSSMCLLQLCNAHNSILRTLPANCLHFLRKHTERKNCTCTVHTKCFQCFCTVQKQNL